MQGFVAKHHSRDLFTLYFCVKMQCDLHASTVKWDMEIRNTRIVLIKSKIQRAKHSIIVSYKDVLQQMLDLFKTLQKKIQIRSNNSPLCN